MLRALLLLFISLNVTAGELWLKVGEVKALAASPSAKIRVGARGIIRVADGDRTVRIIGVKPGATSLVIDEKSFTVRVSFGPTAEFVRDLREVMRPMMGLNLLTEGSIPVVSGTLLRFSDWQELAEVAKHWRGEWQFRAQALPDVARAAIAYFQNIAQTRGFPILRFRAQPEFIAQLPSAAGKLRTTVERELNPFGIWVDTSNSDLALAPMVRTQVVLAEIDKSFSNTFGMSWPAEYQAQLLPNFNADSSLMATLKALEHDGHAQILAQPNLSCRSGGEARFHAGGQLPIRMVGRRTSEVVWKSHGVMLNVKPQADFQGAISLEVETEISLLDMANAVDGIPSIKVNTVKSHLDVSGKRTVALSGLLRVENSQDRDGLPFLSRLPILGPLFSSRSYRNNRSELVVFVTPEIYVPPSDEPIRMPEGWVTGDR